MSAGYVYEKHPNHPLASKKGLVLQHRKVWFDAFGPIPEGHVIHHKNGIKTDNRIENLELLTRSSHMKEHYPNGFAILLTLYAKTVRRRRINDLAMPASASNAHLAGRCPKNYQTG